MNNRNIPGYDTRLDTSLRWYDEIGEFLSKDVS